jgi:hypothetical protein
MLCSSSSEVLTEESTSATSVSFYQTAWCNIPDDVIFSRLKFTLKGREGRVSWMVVNVVTDWPPDRSYSFTTCG